MDETRGGDDLIGGIAVEIQRLDRAANIERQRPRLNARQCSDQLGAV